MTHTVIIADDHPMTVQGMRDVLAKIPELEVVGVAANGIEAISLIKRTKPNCALLDMSMPGANGLEVFFEGKRWSPGTRFAVITGMSAAVQFQQMIDAGIDGIFFKNAPPDEIRAGVEKILAGHKVISPAVSQLVNDVQKNEPLSNRELEVLHSLARGWTTKKIAEHLGVSPKTIDTHRTSLMRKRGVNSTAALLVKAIADGLIEAE